MISLVDILILLILLLPALLALAIGVAVLCFLLGKAVKPGRVASGGRKGLLPQAAVPLAAWAFVSLFMALLTFNYLSGPDCFFCYDPPSLRPGLQFLLSTGIYGLIGYGVVYAPDWEAD